MIDIQDEIEKELYQQSLYAFVKGFWHVVESAKFLPSWHINEICNHLQAVEEGRMKRLIVNIPPRHSKSLIISVFFPIWCWIRRPELQLFTGSHSKELAVRDTTKSRYILQSEKFKYLFGDRFNLVSDQNQKSFFRNNCHGVRQAFSIQGTLTGAGGDIILIDDPLDARDRHSDIMREGCNRWFDESLTTRLNNPETGAIVVIMQRLHVMDLTGYLVEKGGWEHLVIPFEYIPEISFKTSLGSDPRTIENELMHKHWSDETITNKKREMGTEAFLTQYQQVPNISEGGIIKMGWWSLYNKSTKTFRNPILSLDTAFKAGRENDYTVCTVWAQEGSGLDAKYYLIDMYRQKLEFPELKKLLFAIIAKYRPRQVLIEDAASGQSLIQEFRQISTSVITPVKVDRDKTTRVHAVAPIIEAGQVYLDESAPYLVDLYKEFTDFPMGEHDDVVDSVTQAIIYMRNVGSRIPRAYYL